MEDRRQQIEGMYVEGVEAREEARRTHQAIKLDRNCRESEVKRLKSLHQMIEQQRLELAQDTTQKMLAMDGEFVLLDSKANSKSSSGGQVGGGAFILGSTLTNGAKAPFASAFLGISLVMLGLVSYVWWGSRRALAGSLDNLMTETHTLAPSVLFVSTIVPDAELLLVSAATACCVYRGATFDGWAALLNTSVAAYGALT